MIRLIADARTEYVKVPPRSPTPDDPGGPEDESPPA